jgi:hypothetical protein
VKLGSLAVHIEELLSPDGHQFDKAAIDTLLADAEVRLWLTGMGSMGFLPIKRKA